MFSNSYWKPIDAGKAFLRIEIFEPERVSETFVSGFGTLYIKVRTQAVWKHKDDPRPGTHVTFPAWQGVTMIQMGITRGIQRWTGNGWAVSPFPIFFDPLDYGTGIPVPGVDGGIAVENELSFRAVDLGPGPAVLEVRAEGHPRNTYRKFLRTGDWDPRETRRRSRSFTIDGTPPETDARVWDLTHPLVTGTVSDIGAGPLNVKLAVRDTHTGMMWDESRKEWSRNWQDFTIDTDQGGNWYWHFLESDAIGSGRYEVTARGMDAATGTRSPFGNIDLTPEVLHIYVSDRDPVVSVEVPAEDQHVGAAGTFRGTANDDRAIEHLEVTIRDLHTMSYWNYDSGTWSNTQQPTQVDIEVTAISQYDKQLNYRWNWGFEEPASGSGLYELRVFAWDTTGENTGTAGIRFRGANDTIPPSAEIIHPAQGVVLTGSPFGSSSHFIGNAEDDSSGIASVILAVLDVNSGEWWQHTTGTWDSNRDEWAAEYLSDPGGIETRWQDWQFDPDILNNPGSGAYRVHVVPVDVNGNRGQEITSDFGIDHPQR